MKVIKATQQMLETRTLVLGFQGENLRTQLRIDCAATFAEYPNATPALAIKPPTGETYPVFVNRDGTEVVWDIVANNLLLKGDGELQLTFYKDNVIAKTSIGHITVNRSLQIDGEMPDVVATWIENANRKLAEVDAQIVELEGMVDTATDAATRAEQSASTASAKAEQAAGSAATATAKATEATNAAGTATAKAAEAQTAALTATEKATAAAESERIATAKAGDATTAAGTATAKAGQATEAAQTATEKAGDASASARAAQESATDAAASATAASESETAAKASETAAGASATQAAQSAQGASADAQTATQKAAEAQQSATGATQSEQTATQKAGEAAASAQAASDAKTAVEQTAEQLADSLEQIEQNTQDIADLDERKANVDGYYPDMTVGNAEQLNSSKFVENSEPYTLRTSGGSSDIGNREYLDAVVGGTVAWNQMVRDEASENQTDFAPIVTVTDAVEDAAGVKVKIEPVQDLHGYDHPWPAGGGKNLLKLNVVDGESFGGITVAINDDGSVKLTGTTTSTSLKADFATAMLPAGTYFVSHGQGQTGAYLNVPGKVNSTATGASFTLDEETEITVKLFATATGTTFNGNIYPMIRLASETDATFAPYENICPITGWDGVQVWDDPVHGGNIEWNQLISSLNPSVNVYGITRSIVVNDGIRGLQYTGTSESTTNYTACAVEQMYLKLGHVYLFDLGCDLPSGCRISVSTLDQERSRILTPTNVGLRSFGVVINSGTIVDFIAYPQVFDLTRIFGAGNEPTTVEEFRALFPADYYPYNAGEITTVSAVNGDPYRHYSITLPTEAGTVYGGELTINADGSGSLVVDTISAELTGTAVSSNWTDADRDSMGFYTNADSWTYNTGLPNPVEGGGIFSYCYNANVYLSDNWWAANLLFVSGRFNRFEMRIPKNVLTTANVARAKAYLNEHPLQVVYKIAPQTYTLTASEITTLLGTNNIWADTGDLALTYTGTDEHLTLESGKKYLSRISGTDSMLLGSGQEITAAKGADNVFDLTQMFGTAVADYVYGQGAAFFRKWFGKQWYPYNAGELKHVEGLSAHEMVGFNQWDEEWEVGGYNINGKADTTIAIRNKNLVRIIPGAQYYFKRPNNIAVYAYGYSDENYSNGQSVTIYTAPFTFPEGVNYIGWQVSKSAYGSETYKHDICINLSHNNSRNGEYAPYEKHSYPLDSSVILRGIPKVGANGVYWDGDRYLPDGTVERRYGVVDMGSLNYVYETSTAYIHFLAQPNVFPAKPKFHGGLICTKFIGTTKGYNTINNLEMCVDNSEDTPVFRVRDDSYTDAATFKTAMSGVYLVYELATPTTETAQPYHSTQWVSDWGTEEFVSTGIVPVGSETRYPANLRDKLQHLPDAASGNGSYLITQTDGQMVLTPFPAPPSTAGNYVLKATVTNGVATYTWEVAT